MKPALPFQKVAILSPELIFSHPQNPFFDRQMQAELRAWYAVARSRGADAMYARVHGMAAGQAVLRALQDMGARLLAPASLHEDALEVCAWHFSSRDFAALRQLHAPTIGLQGLSCHHIGDLQSAAVAGFDYAFLSPIFATATHPEATPLGLDLLAQACKSVDLPVIALGGLHFENAEACLAAGAAGWAGIRCWM